MNRLEEGILKKEEAMIKKITIHNPNTKDRLIKEIIKELTENILKNKGA